MHWIETFYAAERSLERDRLMAFYADDAWLIEGAQPALVGKDAIGDFFDDHMCEVRSLQHRISNIWDVNPTTVVSELEVTYSFEDGETISLPVLTIAEHRDGLISEFRGYADSVPLLHRVPHDAGVPIDRVSPARRDARRNTGHWIERFYAAEDTLQVENLLAFYRDDAVLRLGGAPPVVSKEGIRALFQEHMGTVDRVVHRLFNVWDVAQNKTVTELEVVYDFEDGKTVNLAAVSVATRHDDLVQQFDIYVDNAPLVQR